jgi:biopolymer transport protein TolR
VGSVQATEENFHGHVRRLRKSPNECDADDRRPAGADHHLIVPVPPRGLNALVPQESPPGQPSSPSQDVIISIRADGTVLLNQDVVELANLEERLKQVFKTNTNRPIFIRGEGKLDFEKVAQVIDLAKGAGLERIGLMTR